MVEDHHLTTTGPNYESPVDEKERNEVTTIAVYEGDSDDAAEKCQISPFGPSKIPECLEP